MKNAHEFFKLATERQLILTRRRNGQKWPWTADEILRDWRFCNVRREDDKTTVWFRENVRAYVSGWRAVQAVVAFRWFNRIETAALINDLLLTEWDSAEARKRLKNVRPVVTGSYMIKTPDGLDKLNGVLLCIDTALEQLRPLAPNWGTSLKGAWEDLRTVPFMGSFMAYEVVTDLRWTNVLQLAGDINTWAAAGPGCTRGLGWVVAGDQGHYSYGSKKDAERMNEAMQELLWMSRLPSRWPFEQVLEMRDIEHTLCETWKYIRLRDYGVRPKQRYRL